MEPQVIRCYYCDFSSGKRGMDRCAPCDGTGSMFMVVTANGSVYYYANTKDGYDKAVKRMMGSL